MTNFQKKVQTSLSWNQRSRKSEPDNKAERNERLLSDIKIKRKRKQNKKLKVSLGKKKKIVAKNLIYTLHSKWLQAKSNLEYALRIWTSGRQCRINKKHRLWSQADQNSSTYSTSYYLWDYESVTISKPHLICKMK